MSTPHLSRLSLACVLAVSCCLWTLLGCAPQKAPDLLSVHSVGPSTLEQGSELRLLGAGFPENRAGKVTLTGTVYTPARAPRKVEWVFPIVADSQTTIVHRLVETDLRERLQDAPHVTFRGQARVQFPPLLEGRPALSGTSETFELDVFSSSAELGDEHSTVSEVKRFEAYLGIELGPDLVISNLSDGSIAARAGLQKGDLLRALDNVHLDSPADFLPRARANIATLEFSRPGHTSPSTVHLGRGDFQVLDPRVAARALAILIGIVGALCVAARPPRFVVWLFTKKSHKLLRRRQFLTDLRARSQFWAYPTFLAVALCYYVLLSVRPSAMYNLDFIACLTLGTMLVISGAFCLGGMRHGHHGFSLLGAMAAAWSQLVSLIPLLLACTFRASELGTLRLTEMADAQGKWPHQWGALSSPWTFLLATAALLALVPVAGRRAPLEGHVSTAGVAGAGGRVLEWSGHLLFVGLWIALFAGSPVGGEGILVGALISSGKLTLVVRLLCEIRTRTGQVRLGESGPLSVRLSWSLAMVAAALGSAQFFVQGALVPYDWLKVLSLSACTAFFALLAVSSQRSWAHTGRKSDPWI